MTFQEKKLLEREFKLASEQINKVEKLIALIKKWNRKINISGVKKEKEILEELIIDSLIPLRFIEIESPVMDAGCGGGFPTLPLKIVKQELIIYAVDSNRKKINFLRTCIRELSLDNVYPLIERIENLKKYHGFFNTVFSKAFLPPPEAIKILIPFLKARGKLIIFATPKTASTIHSKNNIEIIPYTLPISGKERCLIIANRSI